MGFMFAYKHLEKLCGEVMGDQRRVSAYIEEMEQMRMGSRYVPGWEADLRKLKHYRWIRNQIVHDPDCCEEELTGPEDILWLEDFYGRIMEQNDPLALYRKATLPKPAPISRKTKPQITAVPTSTELQRSGTVQSGYRRSPMGCMLLLIGIGGLLAVMSVIGLLI